MAQRPEGMILRKAKLSTLKPQITTIKPLIGRATGDEKARLRQRDQEIEWRAWYGTERWKQMRKRIWARDNYTCQVTGALCIGKYPAGNSPVADHKIPHRGDPALFWDENNIHTVSKKYHDSQKQREERSRGRW